MTTIKKIIVSLFVLGFILAAGQALAGGGNGKGHGPGGGDGAGDELGPWGLGDCDISSNLNQTPPVIWVAKNNRNKKGSGSSSRDGSKTRDRIRDC